MSLLDFTQIPGFAEAANEEQANRELAFQPMPPPISGVVVRHMNARHHILLSGCRNRFVCGGRPRPEDVAMFLWFLSPEYSTEPGMREAFVAETVRALDWESVVLDCYRYLARVYQDWPAHENSGPQKMYMAPVVWIVDLLASEYGWTDEAILEMPLARIWQYVRRITLRKSPKAPMFNPSDRLVGELLRAQMSGKPLETN